MTVRSALRAPVRAAVRAPIILRKRWTPADLFAQGQQGVWYEPKPEYLYQDAAGTVPVTADGDPVGLMLDISGNDNHVTFTGATLRFDETGRPCIELSISGYGAFDGIAAYGTDAPLEMMAAATIKTGASFPVIFGGDSNSSGVFYGFTDNGRTRFALAGGTGGQTVVTGDDPVLDDVSITNFRYDGTSIKAYRAGDFIAEGAHSGTFGTRSVGMLGGNVPNSLIESPMYFYAGVILKRILTTTERNQLGAILASISGAPYAPEETLSDPPSSGPFVYALGDSTVAGYSGETSVLTLVNSAHTKVDVSDPGDTIAQQKTLWLAENPEPASVEWTVIQVGHNDVSPSTTALDVINELQDLVDTVRGDIGPDSKLFISQMTPARSRYISLFGSTDGEAVYQQWLSVNEAIAGEGANSITNVDGRVTAHEPLMNDGSGNLKSEYDTGDGIHPNDAGRQVNATAWEDTISSTVGITL